MNGCEPVADFDPKTVTAPVNRWIIAKLGDTANEVGTAIDAYRFNESANAIYGFAWGTFCDWYLEFTKPILSGQDEAAIAETKATTAWVLDQILHILHPVMPYITEELWASAAEERAHQLISAQWPEKHLDDADANAEMEWLVQLISTIRTTRSELNVPGSVKLSVALQGTSEKTAARLKRNKDLISRMARLSTIETVADPIAKGCVQAVVAEATVFINVIDHMDVAAEQARLEKEIANLDKLVLGKQKKLANEKFVQNAPADVVETERTKVSELTAKNDKFKEALARLKTAL